MRELLKPESLMRGSVFTGDKNEDSTSQNSGFFPTSGAYKPPPRGNSMYALGRGLTNPQKRMSKLATLTQGKVSMYGGTTEDGDGDGDG